MRRGAPSAAAALAAALALSALAAPSSGSPAASTSADCLLVPHSKTVVKRVKVKRGGEIVKVKRRKKVRWTTCEPVAAPAPPSPAACAVPSSAIGITALDDGFDPRYLLSRPCVSAGTVHVELVNEGEDPHHVFLRPAGTPDGTAATHRIPGAPPFQLQGHDGMGPPPSADADLSLPAGDWYLWCDLLDHEEAGMHTTLQAR